MRSYRRNFHVSMLTARRIALLNDLNNRRQLFEILVLFRRSDVKFIFVGIIEFHYGFNVRRIQVYKVDYDDIDPIGGAVLLLLPIARLHCPIIASSVTIAVDANRRRRRF